MAGATVRIPMCRRILMCENYDSGNSGDLEMRLDDTVFEFLDESPESSSSHGSVEDEENEEGDEEKVNKTHAEDDRIFWENQHQILRDTLCRTSSLESRIRNATKQALKEAQLAGNFCVCRKPVAGGCRNCLIREICGRLQNAGFNSAVCRSKWRSSPDIPSGEHTFLDVVSSSSKKAEIKVIIELNFRAEFEVARASEEYKQLIGGMPEVFIGKVERLQSLIKILCSAAKKSMKENKMHMGPWRKQRYMQAKWLRSCERIATAAPPLSTGGSSSRAARPRASMLTVDLHEGFHSFNRTAVEVL
ncbi:uncharacterized protein LOC127807265 [Diospyros lotus]|uniref:uncharacterized protein LOC127807265 n=1 Tax=Diospyros lotus TaxID=55363 RepID=UPI00225401DF|nr:uncharacterized protein LOC127807265 [Diospyros lotus]